MVNYSKQRTKQISNYKHKRKGLHNQINQITTNPASTLVYHPVSNSDTTLKPPLVNIVSHRYVSSSVLVLKRVY